jgi:hypothetical protein
VALECRKKHDEPAAIKDETATITRALRSSGATIKVGTRDVAFPLATGSPAWCGKEAVMLDRIGVLGLVGFLIFAGWFIGWIFLGFHDGLYHVLFPISVVLMVAQGVRRVAR